METRESGHHNLVNFVFPTFCKLYLNFLGQSNYLFIYLKLCLMTFHKCVFRLVILPPIIIIAIQLSWENLIGTSDLFLRDCMKMQNEEKNVNIASIKPVVAQNQHCHLLSVHGDDDGPAGVRDADDQHRLPLLHHLPQAHEAHQPQTHRQWPGHQQGDGAIISIV